MNAAEALKKLKALGSAKNRAGMVRFGIATDTAYGVPVPKIRSLAKQIGKNHPIALQLWASKVHEARILAAMVDEAAKVSESQAEAWVNELDSWDVCDGLCGELLQECSFAWKKALEWCNREEPFVRRAGFVILARYGLASQTLHDKKFETIFKLIQRHAKDPRNFVKKAVNWALRQIGKKNLELNRRAIAVAEKIKKQPYASARWIADDALRELRSQAVMRRLKEKAKA